MQLAVAVRAGRVLLLQLLQLRGCAGAAHCSYDCVVLLTELPDKLQADALWSNNRVA